MSSKQDRKVFYMAMKKSEFEKLQKYLDSDDNPVYLTFLDIANYTNNKKDKAVMIKTAFEKA